MTETENKNLLEGLMDEINRVRGVIKQYEELPDNAGRFGVALMTVYITQAEEAIKRMDVVTMLMCYRELKECS